MHGCLVVLPGVTKNASTTPLDKLERCIRVELENTAKRFYAVVDPVRVRHRVTRPLDSLVCVVCTCVCLRVHACMRVRSWTERRLRACFADWIRCVDVAIVMACPCFSRGAWPHTDRW
jgi:hypothetical protein